MREVVGYLTNYSTGLFNWLNTFQFKSCTVSHDESLVISNLLCLNTETLIGDKGPMRMARLWLMLEVVLKEIILHAGSNLEIECFR
jgi:hypothetical protein